MSIVSDKRIVLNPENGILPVEGEDEDHYCPCCGALLKYRDRRLRICRIEGGHTYHCVVRRLKCTRCGKLLLPQIKQKKNLYIDRMVAEL